RTFGSEALGLPRRQPRLVAKPVSFEWAAINAPAIFQAGARSVDAMIDAPGTLGKSILGLYRGRAGVGSSYGAAGSLVVPTVWVYYASMIVFFDAEDLRSRYRR